MSCASFGRLRGMSRRRSRTRCGPPASPMRATPSRGWRTPAQASDRPYGPPRHLRRLGSTPHLRRRLDHRHSAAWNRRITDLTVTGSLASALMTASRSLNALRLGAPLPGHDEQCAELEDVAVNQVFYRRETAHDAAVFGAGTGQHPARPGRLRARVGLPGGPAVRDRRHGRFSNGAAVRPEPRRVHGRHDRLGLVPDSAHHRPGDRPGAGD